MEISKLNFWEYIFLDAEQMRTSLSDYLMNRVRKGFGKAFSLQDENSIVAYIITSRDSIGLRIDYIYTHPQLRRRGYATQLLQRVTQDENGPARVNLSESLAKYETVSKCLLKSGFIKAGGGLIYNISFDEKMWQWAECLKINRMKELLLRNDTECTAFRDMTESAREQLLNSKNNEFRNRLDPLPYLTEGGCRADEEISIAMCRGGTLCSYVLITRPTEDTVCFEQISESEEKIGSGSVTAPLCCAMEKIRTKPEIKKMTMFIPDENTASKKFLMFFIPEENITTSRNEIFIYAPSVV